jgi:creatinine amidohydrolase
MVTVAACAAVAATAASLVAQNTPKGYRLENHAWPDAEAILRPETVVVIPLGAAAKEHGPHLRLRNDLTIAEYFTRRVLDASDVVIAPTLTYHFYPAFVEYPGSTGLTLETARDLTVQVVRSLARFGPRRFYVLNTGVSTVRPLEQAAKEVASDGVLMRFTDFAGKTDAASRSFRQQKGGSHADEIETSLMLHIAPASVDMKKAVAEFDPEARLGPNAPLTRQRGGRGVFSASGVWGDATLATPQKGAAIAEALAAGILDDIEKLRATMPPAPSAPAPPAVRVPRRTGRIDPPPPGECSPGDLRRIMQIGPAFTYYWATADAKLLSMMWARDGDIIHPNGDIERGPEIIMMNRLQLFAQREYRGSKHPLTLTMVRCPTYDIAVADGIWNMSGVKNAEGKELPQFEGQATIVAKRVGEGWAIEAYRYTIKPPAQPMPVWLSRPGWPDK